MALSSHAINELTSETNLNELVEKVVALNKQIQISLEKLQIDIENTKEELKEPEDNDRSQPDHRRELSIDDSEKYF